MKILRGVLVVFELYYVGELISTTLSLPFSGNLIGMILLFVLLQLHIAELEQIAMVSGFLLGHPPFFFLPAGVVLMTSFSAVKGLWIRMLVIRLVITIATIGYGGYTIQHMMKRKLKP